MQVINDVDFFFNWFKASYLKMDTVSHIVNENSENFAKVTMDIGALSASCCQFCFHLHEIAYGHKPSLEIDFEELVPNPNPAGRQR